VQLQLALTAAAL